MNETVTKEFWIGFRDAHGWPRHFLKKGYQHCYVLFKEDGRWIELNPRNYIFQCFLLNEKEVSIEDFPKLLNEDKEHPFIRIKIEQKWGKRFAWNVFKRMHCTNMVKYILGVRLLAWTPYQLYKKLVHMSPSMMAAKGILEIEII